MGRPCSSTASVLHLIAAILFPLSHFVLADPQSDASNICITAHGDNTAGEIYTLECSVIVSTMESSQPDITWMDIERILSYNITTNSDVGIYEYSSNLTLNPLSASHAGMFTCEAMVGGAVESMSINVTVKGECTEQNGKMCS